MSISRAAVLAVTVPVMIGLVALARGWRQPAARAVAPAPAVPAPLSYSDSFGDGTPDFLRLDSPADRRAFRWWFTFLADELFHREPAELPAEVNDCAALVRFAYREALKKHDGAWAAAIALRRAPAMPSVAKYAYPYTPLQANLFRIRPGEFSPDDLTRGSFAQFADAQTLMLFNTTPVGKDVERGEPGDLLFFHQPGQRQPFHVMILLPAAVVYHTGETPGEIRRPSLDQLRQHPEPRWRPFSTNPYFLGVYRWNILRD
jgi:uncharacterized protein YfaT (DUF1175 family)